MNETEPRWKFHARNLFFLLMIASAIPLALAAYFDITYHKSGTERPTAENTVENTQHARTKYIAPSEAEHIRLMWTLFLAGFPASILFGIILRFAFKVDIFRQEPIPAWVDGLMNNLKKEQR